MSDTLPPDFTLWDRDRPADLKAGTAPLRYEWQQHDLLALSRLTPDQREAQLEARRTLMNFVLDYAKALDDVDEIPTEWQSIVAMIDLLNDMVTDVAEDPFAILAEAVDDAEGDAAG